jgi:hypothetical protein
MPALTLSTLNIRAAERCDCAHRCRDRRFISFVGTLCLQADAFAGPGKSGADMNFEPRITWAALDLGCVQARIKGAEALLTIYERTVLIAPGRN